MRYIILFMTCFLCFSPIYAQGSDVSIHVSEDIMIAPDQSEDKEDTIDKYHKLSPQEAIFLPETGEESHLSLACLLLGSGIYIYQLGKIEKEDQK